MPNSSDAEWMLPRLQAMHARIRAAVLDACEGTDPAQLAEVAADTEADTIYAVDRVSETALVEAVDEYIAHREPVVLIAEGLPGGCTVRPEGAPEERARWRVIVDPIDGTRGLMYQKRSAWVLTGVAPNRGPDTSLPDIELALQTEIPLVKQHLSDQVWAVRGRGASARRYHRLADSHAPLRLRPSRADTIAHGFASLARYFPGGRDVLARIDDELAEALLGPRVVGRAACFEDQYICSGGQLYELAIGHDRFVADLRPLLDAVLSARGEGLGLCSHPYDVCTELIARELGVQVTDPHGDPLQAPLDTETNVAWIGYANAALRRRVEPVLQELIRRHLSDVA